MFSFAIVLACLGVSDGNPKKVYSRELREGKELTKMQTAKLKGMHVANKHVRGWRADLGGTGWPSKLKDLVERCWAQEGRDRPSFDEVCAEVETWKPSDFGEIPMKTTAVRGGGVV